MFIINSGIGGAGFVPAPYTKKRGDCMQDIFQKIAEIDSFEYREQQVHMADMIMRSLNENKPCLIEAATGIGKSLGLLVPAILTSIEKKMPVIVCTATINLQEQYIHKDLPFLKDILKGFGIDFKHEAAKGRSHYACTTKIEKYEELGGIKVHLNGPDSPSNPHLQELWPQLCSDESCLKSNCENKEICHYYLERERWNDVNILVSNHALTLQDISLKHNSDGKAQILPEPCAYIFDEAHHVESIARNSIGEKITNVTLRHAINNITSIISYVDVMRLSASVLSNEQFFQTMSDLTDNPRQLLQVKPEMIEAFDELRNRMKGIVDNAIEGFAHLDKQDADRTNIWTSRIIKHLQTIERAFHQQRHDMVYWVEKTPNRPNVHYTMNMTPISIAPLMNAMLFSRYPTVLLSATLGDFHYLETQLGTEDAYHVSLPPVFDYKSNALLYVPKIVSYKHKDYTNQLLHQIQELVEMNQGRALVLFTAWGHMNTIFEQIQIAYPKMKQGDDTRHNLLEWFKSTDNSVLFATQSFWEGVDVPGDDLSLVIIDKIPFQVPSDPVTEAIYKHHEEQGGNSFIDISLPIAAQRLRQGFGRLIRSTTDRGVVAVLDSRLAEARYRQKLLDSLPPAKRTRTIAHVKNFIKNIQIKGA